MLQVGKIKLRDIKELQYNGVVTPKKDLSTLKKCKNPKSSNSKNLKEVLDNETVKASNTTNTLKKSAAKRVIKSAFKATPSNQKRIDSFFTSCPKNYDIKLPKQELPTPLTKSKTHNMKTKAKGSTNKRNKQPSRRPNTRRKRLFTDSTEPSTDNMSDTSYMKDHKNKRNNIECITIDSDSELENNINNQPINSVENSTVNKSTFEIVSNSKNKQTLSANCCEITSVNTSPTTASSLSFGQKLTKTSCQTIESVENSSVSGNGRRKPKPCPTFKIIENTSFAVDAFQFGYIDNVTHYFLTHFHADHYIGLTKSFSMPLYVSPITARLLRAFIPIQEQYIHELELNQSVVINGIEITSLDANHCPGSIMFVFKFLDTGKCVLHTGDFRASPNMESEPIFWNNHIHTIYLDTTYISDKYAFCTQYESIEKARDMIDTFMTKHYCNRILFICGSYVIGKERFWSSLAEELNLKVWAEGNRRKALIAINDERFNRLLVEDPNEASMHILPMGKVTYLGLAEYFKLYEHNYDMLLALRPSGWEKDTKPRYGSKISLVGVEYSEHSSYAEMQRFVKYLKPDQVISTVPTGKSLMKTSTVPQNWYKYDKLKPTSNYQPSIDSFLAKTSQAKLSIRLPNASKGGVEQFVSPLKSSAPHTNIAINNSLQADEEVVSIISSSQPAEVKEHNEEAYRDNSTANAQNGKNLIKNKSISNKSSEDFEKLDFVVKRKSAHTNKNNFKKENDHDKSLIQTRQKRNQKQLTPKNMSVRNDEIKFTELSQTRDNKLKRNNRSQTETSQLHISSSGKELNNSNLSSAQKRITRSQNKSNKLTRDLSNTKSNPYMECSESASHKKSKMSIDSASSNKTTPFETQFPAITQQRVTRSKISSSKASISFNIENGNEHEFESKLLQITEQSSDTTISNPAFAINFNKYPENPIFKSTTDSTVDRLSYCGINFNNINSPITCENFLEDFEELPTKSSTNKRNTFNLNCTQAKRTKPTFNAQAILKTILEQGEDFDRFNCSQLAGLVVETVNKQNPDNSRDHIPADLLSDADDDWM